MIPKKVLEDFYLKDGKSIKDVAGILSCSSHQVSYWMLKYNINARSISEAIYLKNNPGGDPFNFTAPKTLKAAELLGFGLGLYWGEGTKADKCSVRLGNTDPALIKKFMEFLVKTFKIEKSDLKFGLQLFTDIDEKEAMDFWVERLKIKKSQFYKTVITKSRSLGTYRKKNRFGVITVYYHNKKLRDMLVSLLPL